MCNYKKNGREFNNQTQKMTISKYQISQRKLKSEVNICKPTNCNNVKKYVALWDTGAVESLITAKVVSDLELEKTGETVIYVDANGNQKKSERYFCFIQIDGHTKTYTLELAELSEPKDDCNVIIGMDIIETLKLTIDKTNFEVQIE
jgi:predicted aspartyl protease